eukprot:scaffold6788_cov71-Cyclotella_meneghiniana.AAC.6
MDDEGQYPSYDDDEAFLTLLFVQYNNTATFALFLREHTILTTDASLEDEETFLEPTEEGKQLLRRTTCYPPHLQRIKNRHTYTSSGSSTFIVEVPLSELVSWDAVRGSELANRATKNGMRYQELFCKVIDSVLASMDVTSTSTSSGGRAANRDSIDVLSEQRRAAQDARMAEQAEMGGGVGGEDANGPLGGGGLENDAANAGGTGAGAGGATEDLPPLLMRRYELRILPLKRPGVFPPFDKQYREGKSVDTTSLPGSSAAYSSTISEMSLRQIRSNSMGQLVTLRGMIVRASDLYKTNVNSCRSDYVRWRNAAAPVRRKRACAILLEAFTKMSLKDASQKQELRCQELPNQVPMGHVPRSMSVHCRGELTRLATPGDVVTIDGVFLPQRVAESGYRAMKAGLVSTSFLEAQNIVIHKKSYEEDSSDYMSEEERQKMDEEIHSIAHGDDPVGTLSAAIAPEIFGHEDIKRALLLQLVGGCTRKLPDGMRIRGDINICLMGDPGVAKSQLLKHVASVAPRGVYTTGKGSSGVGLTAAITKDVTTGELALEGGALVLADRGICAIDEFDKMDEADRTAIHEVMEQQTVSVAKAGIVATLNARSAVLAAANPLYGRYNRRKSLSENINLPNSLLSRFDLMFLILDIADVDRDMSLARHVTFVHQNEGTGGNRNNGNAAPTGDEDDEDELDQSQDDEQQLTVSSNVLREYISRARKHQPVVPVDVAPYIVEAYVTLRSQGTPTGGRTKNGDQTVMTARQLLSILRLSQALARLRFSDYVAREDVDEAIRLTHMSKSSLLDEEDPHGGSSSKRKWGGEDVTSRIFNIIRDYATASRTDKIELKLCEAMVLRKGFTQQQLSHCLEEYQNLSILHLNSTGTHISLVEEGY